MITAAQTTTRRAPAASRMLRHREIVARLDRHLAAHLDLAAEVHQERPVGDAFDLDPVDRPHSFDDLLEMLGAGRVDRDVADLRRAFDADEVDRAERTARVADRLRESCERAWTVERRTRSVALKEAETWLISGSR